MLKNCFTSAIILLDCCIGISYEIKSMSVFDLSTPYESKKLLSVIQINKL